MQLELINGVASLGLGAVLAVIVLMWKRTDDKRYIERLEAREDRLIGIVDANTTAMRDLKHAIDGLATTASMEERLLERLAGSPQAVAGARRGRTP